MGVEDDIAIAVAKDRQNWKKKYFKEIHSINTIIKIKKIDVKDSKKKMSRQSEEDRIS